MKSVRHNTRATKRNQEQFEKAQKIAVSLSTDVDRALAAHEMFARAVFKKDIAPRFDNTYQAWGYNVIQTALLSELIMTLTRMHDADDRSASIPQLIRLLADPSVVESLKANAQRWIMERPSHHIGPVTEEILNARERSKRERAEAEAEKMERLTRNASRRALRFETDSMRHTLQKFRNKHLAHSVLKRPNLDLKYANLATILTKTALIVDDLRLAFTGHNINSLESRKACQTRASHFWKHAILPFGEEKIGTQRAKRGS